MAARPGGDSYSDVYGSLLDFNGDGIHMANAPSATPRANPTPRATPAPLNNPLTSESAQGAKESRGRRAMNWIPLYAVALVLMIVNLILVGVSSAVDIGVIDATPAFRSSNVFDDLCTAGPASVTDDGIRAQFYQVSNPLYPTTWRSEMDEVLDQMQPITFTIDPPNPTSYRADYTVTVFDKNNDVIGYCPIGCISGYSESMTYTVNYTFGSNFFNAPGAPRIHKVSRVVTGWIQTMTAFFFVFSLFALVLHLLVCALRVLVMLHGPVHGHAYEKLHERCCQRCCRIRCKCPGCGCCSGCCCHCCPCNSPHPHVRLLAAVITCLVLNAIVTIAQFGICGKGRLGDPNHAGGRNVDFKTTGTYYAILALMLVFELAALGCVCAIYAMRL